MVEYKVLFENQNDAETILNETISKVKPTFLFRVVLCKENASYGEMFKYRTQFDTLCLTACQW